MYIEIKENIVEEKSDIIENLYFILTSYRNGNHIIGFENSIIIKNYLNELFKEYKDILQIIDDIVLKNQDTKALKNFLSLRVEVGNSSTKLQKIENKDNCKIISIPITYFDNTLNECQFISEDLSDVDFYMALYWAARHHDYIKISNKIKSKYKAIDGGGSKVPKIYERIANSKEITLAICDSDKTSKSCIQKQDTAGYGLEKAHNSLPTKIKLSDYYVLCVREKENLISPSKLLTCKFLENNRALLELKKFEGEQFEEKLGYVKLSKNKINIDDNDLGCIVSRGLSKTGLENFVKEKLLSIDFIQENNYEFESETLIPLNVFQNLPSYLENDYSIIFEKILNWTCCYARMRFSA